LFLKNNYIFQNKSCKTEQKYDVDLTKLVLPDGS
jgi:hypothetical protein